MGRPAVRRFCLRCWDGSSWHGEDIYHSQLCSGLVPLAIGGSGECRRLTISLLTIVGEKFPFHSLTPKDPANKMHHGESALGCITTVLSWVD